MITLHNGATPLDIEPDDTSYRYRALMQVPQLILKFALPGYVDFSLGTWCDYQGERFTLHTPATLKKQGVRNIEYTLTMGTDADTLSLYKMRNTVDHRLKYSLSARPVEIVREIVANLNQREGRDVWSVGDCVEAGEKTIEINHSYALSTLQTAADTFETEWEIDGHAICLHKVERFKATPLPLSYGQGNGFIPGVGRTSQSGASPVGRLYAQGGTRNIDRSKYGGWDETEHKYTTSFPYRLSSSELRLPASQRLEYEGRTYVTDADGTYVERVDKPTAATREDSIDLSDTYPSRLCKVSRVEVADAERNYYDIIDATIPDKLDYNKYLIAGEKPTVVFQTGMLAGDEKQFEFTYDHAQRRFKLVPQEIDGVTMPGGSFVPVAGDTFAVFGIMLPDEYVCDDATQTGASWDMFRACAKKLYESEDPKFTFTGELQGLWAKRHWDEVGGRLAVGSYIRFSDPQFAPEGVDIRITGIKDYVNAPHSPTLELSNETTGKSITSALTEIGRQEVTIDNARRDAVSYTKRRFRDAVETLAALKGVIDGYGESVNPITIQTMALLVGDESLQYRFVKSRDDLTPAPYNISYDQAAKRLRCPDGWLQHMTLGITALSSSHEAAEYKVWPMGAYESPYLDQPARRYYLYARVSATTTGETGTWLLSERSLAMRETTGYYNLLAGVLNAEIDGERSFATLYGFTEILPGRITTDRIVSSDGASWFDMQAGSMRLGDALDWNSKGDRTLRLKGTIVQSRGGTDESALPCFRGVWSETTAYYEGDEVTYDDGGVVSTYRLTARGPLTGIRPTEGASWEIVAKGGKDGTSAAAIYAGEYDSTKTYHGNAERTDIVRYKDTYYIARSDAPRSEFAGIAPDDDAAYWRPFGATLDSVATSLLLAEGANVGGWVFRDGRLWSQDGGCWLDGKTGNVRLAGFVTKKVTRITDDNIADYADRDPDADAYMMDFTKTGSIIVFEASTKGENALWFLPSLYNQSSTAAGRELARSFIGQTFVIYNNSTVNIALTGLIVESDDDPDGASYAITPRGSGRGSSFMALECKIRTGYDSDGKPNGLEEIYWLIKAKGTFRAD